MEWDSAGHGTSPWPAAARPAGRDSSGEPVARSALPLASAATEPAAPGLHGGLLSHARRAARGGRSAADGASAGAFAGSATSAARAPALPDLRGNGGAGTACAPNSGLLWRLGRRGGSVGVPAASAQPPPRPWQLLPAGACNAQHVQPLRGPAPATAACHAEGGPSLRLRRGSAALPGERWRRCGASVRRLPAKRYRAPASGRRASCRWPSPLCPRRQPGSPSARVTREARAPPPHRARWLRRPPRTPRSRGGFFPPGSGTPGRSRHARSALGTLRGPHEWPRGRPGSSAAPPRSGG
mmetsp:Transcript_91714/g.296774  ORF Transcript_91714/g.296774 Transcript_91714/m.296774 type:complete len:297 (-) Transcript_91714:2456-3346(-)